MMEKEKNRLHYFFPCDNYCDLVSSLWMNIVTLLGVSETAELNKIVACEIIIWLVVKLLGVKTV